MSLDSDFTDLRIVCRRGRHSASALSLMRAKDQSSWVKTMRGKGAQPYALIENVLILPGLSLEGLEKGFWAKSLSTADSSGAGISFGHFAPT